MEETNYSRANIAGQDSEMNRGTQTRKETLEDGEKHIPTGNDEKHVGAALKNSRPRLVREERRGQSRRAAFQGREEGVKEFKFIDEVPDFRRGIFE
jgi:hypothetical protein